MLREIYIFKKYNQQIVNKKFKKGRQIYCLK